MRLNTLTTPSPPPIAKVSPLCEKSTVKQALDRSLICAMGLKKSKVSNNLTSLDTAPPAIRIFPCPFLNCIEYTYQGSWEGRASSHGTAPT